ncbi:MAG TPA: regulatory protein RecX [Candidatus Limnocylindria bacterium]|nr:regulatory protein RecX [Candidatus Limnocylindria bacterium]
MSAWRASAKRSRGPRAERPPLDADAALDVAARYLATRPRTRWELSRRLQRAGLDEPVIEATLERLAALGLADDVAFARWWAEQRDRHSPRGRRLVEAELRRRGIPREVIEELRGAEMAEPAFPEEQLPQTEAERARIALQRHLRGRPLPDDRAALQRVGMFLVRRGFDPETVRSTLRAAADEAGERAETLDDDA